MSTSSLEEQLLSLGCTPLNLAFLNIMSERLAIEQYCNHFPTYVFHVRFAPPRCESLYGEFWHATCGDANPSPPLVLILLHWTTHCNVLESEIEENCIMMLTCA